MIPEPEKEAPSPKPTPPNKLQLSDAAYLTELANRITRHAKESCIGTQPKKEIGYAAAILHALADDFKTRESIIGQTIRSEGHGAARFEGR